MSLNKLLLILITALLTSFCKSTYAQDSSRIPQWDIANGLTNKRIATHIGNMDLVYGNVKRIIQTVFYKDTRKSISKSIKIHEDTLNFDEKQRITNKYLGPNFGSIIPSDNPYFDQYALYREKKMMPEDTIGMRLVDGFDKNGELSERRYSFKDTSLSYARKMNFDNDGITSYVIYNSKKDILFKEVYKFKDGYLLAEADDYDMDGKLKRRIHFIYEIFDKSHNWTQRIEKWQNLSGATEKVIITKRKITYY